MYIAIAILLFGAFIAAHELGHFVAARLCGIRVLEFSIGMGPKILKKQGKETLYTLRALPIGGFCAMEGEDSLSEDSRSFTAQSIWKRSIVLIAGSFMNIIVGLILILIVFANSEGITAPKITGFMDGSTYEAKDGLQTGDEIYKINGERIYFASNFTTILSLGNGKTADIVVVRDGNKIELSDFPISLHEYENEDGTKALKYGIMFGNRESGIGAELKYSFYCALDFIRMVRLSISALFSGLVGVQDLSGPVGIVDMINTVGKDAPTVGDALINISYFAAFISINLAVMNLLPIPAVDGGRIVFMFISKAIELIMKRKLNPKYEGYIHSVALALLMGLMVFVMFNDIIKIVRI